MWWYSKCLLCREPQNSGTFHFGTLGLIGIKIRRCSCLSNCLNFSQSFLTEILLWLWGLRQNVVTTLLKPSAQTSLNNFNSPSFPGKVSGKSWCQLPSILWCWIKIDLSQIRTSSLRQNTIFLPPPSISSFPIVFLVLQCYMNFFVYPTWSGWTKWQTLLVSNSPSLRMFWKIMVFRILLSDTAKWLKYLCLTDCPISLRLWASTQAVLLRIRTLSHLKSLKVAEGKSCPMQPHLWMKVFMVGLPAFCVFVQISSCNFHMI